MVFGRDILGTEDFEIIEKNWEKFVKVGQKLGRDGCLGLKVGGKLKMILKNFPEKWKKSDFCWNADDADFADRD